MLIILLIVVVLAYLYVTTKKSEVSKINNQGGIFFKYKILIEYFLEYPGVKIETKNSYSVILILKDKYAVTRITIGHGFEDVSVFWELNSIAYGKHNLKWKFPESLSQYQMIELIENELEIYNKNLFGNGF